MFNLGLHAVSRRMGHTRSASGTLLLYLSAADVAFMGCTGGFGTCSLFRFALGQTSANEQANHLQKPHWKNWVQPKPLERAAEWLGFLCNSHTVIMRNTIMIKSRFFSFSEDVTLPYYVTSNIFMLC